MPHSGSLQSGRLRNLREKQHRHRRRRNHHQSQTRLRPNRPRCRAGNRLRTRRRCLSCRQDFRAKYHHRPVARHRSGSRCQKSQRQKNRGTRRWRPRTDVRLRLQRNARIDASSDHVRPPSRSRTDRHPQIRKSPMASPRCQVPSLGGIRRWQTHPHHQRRHLHPTRRRQSPRRDREILHRENHQKSPA